MPLWTKNVSSFLIVGSPVGQNSAAIKFTAVTPGTTGNSITIAIVVAGNNTSLTVGVVSSAITINLATNAGGAATSTVAQVISAVNSSGPANALVVASPGCVGASGIVAALSTTHLAGGVNQSAPYWQDSVPAADGWRSSVTGEQLVVGEASLATVPTTQATVQNSYIVSSNQGRTHYHSGIVSDTILFAVEYNKPVYFVQKILVDGSSNKILLTGDYTPSSVVVNLINPGGTNTINGRVQYINFENQLVITVNLGTSSGSVTTTNTQLNTFCAANGIPFSSGGSGGSTVTPAVLTGPFTRTTNVAPTIPITIGTNTRNLTYIEPLHTASKSIASQNSGWLATLPVPSFETLLFGYTVVSGDSATAGNVQIGTGAVAAHHAFGTSNSEVTASAPGSAGNNLYVTLNAPTNTNVASLSSVLSTTTTLNDTITYNLTTSGLTAATLSAGTSNSEITFTAVTPGTSGNSITIAIVVAGNNTVLSVGVVSNAITINSATGSGGAATSTVAQIIAAVAASGPAAALVTATTTGNGTGTIGALSSTPLATGANASSSTTVTQLITFAGTDPHTATIGTTLTTTGNGTGDVAGAAKTQLSSGANATATITYASGTAYWVGESSDAHIATTFQPPATASLAVN